MDEDATSVKKRYARKGQAYYEGEHDIKDFELYYCDANGNWIPDKLRSNIKISHPFFTELVDQATQYILSGDDAFMKSDIPALQTELDAYFNDNEDFVAELSEVLTDCQTKGFSYMFGYKNAEDRLAFQCADSIGVVEIEARFASDRKDHVLYHYIDRIDKEGKKIKRIMDWNAEEVCFYIQDGEGEIVKDETIAMNPKPHTVYKEEGKEGLYQDSFGFIPFFRLDNNKKQFSSLKTIKELIDDYDLMSCGLSNNLQDASEYLVVVSGFQGDNLDELVTNTKVKKHIGVDGDGSVEFKTVDVPHEARKAKLELDEKNIFRFGMGLNTDGLKDTSATTNIAIKAAYSLLDLKCSKLIIRLKQLLRKILNVVLDEINNENGTDYQQKDIYFDFKPQVMSNELENAQIKQIEAQEQQARITTLLNLATQLDNETLQQQICDVLDLDWNELKGKLPNPNEVEDELNAAQSSLNAVPVEDTV